MICLFHKAANLLFLCFILCLGLCRPVFAQTHDSLPKRSIPIPFEVMLGNNRFAMQIFTNNYFDKRHKFNLISVTSSAASYKNDLKQFDFINNSIVGFELVHGFGITTGISMNARTGFNPTAGIEYVFRTRSLLFVIAPDIQLTNNHSLDGLSVLEFTPRLSESWGMYIRLQGLYSYDPTDALHERSYFNARIGPYYKQLAFGVGSNLDWYGPRKGL